MAEALAFSIPYRRMCWLKYISGSWVTSARMNEFTALPCCLGCSYKDEFMHYILQVKKNADAMAKAFVKRGYDLISGGTDNHMMLIDLRNKNITGKDAEQALVKADITANKNMVPFDTQSPFVTSGIRVGTPAVTTRGLVESDMEAVVSLIDEVITNHEDETVLNSVAKRVHAMMSHRPLFA